MATTGSIKQKKIHTLEYFLARIIATNDANVIVDGETVLRKLRLVS
jgi:hypothetical protein